MRRICLGICRYDVYMDVIASLGGLAIGGYR